MLDIVVALYDSKVKDLKKCWRSIHIWVNKIFSNVLMSAYATVHLMLKNNVRKCYWNFENYKFRKLSPHKVNISLNFLLTGKSASKRIWEC